MPDRLSDGLPDCQLHGPKAKAHDALLPNGHLGREVFCYFCGASCGYVWGSVVHAYILCDPCFFEKGPPPGMTQIPDAVARGLA